MLSTVQPQVAEMMRHVRQRTVDYALFSMITDGTINEAKYCNFLIHK